MRITLVSVGFIALLILSSTVKAQEISSEDRSEEPKLLEYDSSDMDPDVKYSFEVSGALSNDIVRRWSNRVDDVDCEHPTVTSQGGRSPTVTDLSERGSPQRALYEWHLCFVIDGQTYRGWRGFDPGHGSLVELECQIEANTPPNDTYACETVDLTLNPENYGEAAYSCRRGEPCRRFESYRDFAAWKRLPEFTTEDALEAAVALIRHELEHESYLSANPMDYFVKIGEEDLPAEIAASLAMDKIRFFPASAQGEDRGMSMTIGGFSRKSDGAVEVDYSFYCGPLCASSHTAVMKKNFLGKWKVISTEMHWIS